MSFTPPPTETEPLAHQVSIISRALNEDFGVLATMHTLVRAVVETVPGALCAEVTIAGRGGGTVHAPHGSDRSVAHPDGGPCDGNRRRGTSWPCRLDLPLLLADREIGLLTLWCGHEPSGHEDDRSIGVILATHAALALHHAGRYEQLTAALDTRDMIGQAKGMLMARYGLTADRAFDMLRRLSMDGNRRLSDLADEIVRSEGRPPVLTTAPWTPRTGRAVPRPFPGSEAVPA